MVKEDWFETQVNNDKGRGRRKKSTEQLLEKI
jgi:hypothetical protein